MTTEIKFKKDINYMIDNINSMLGTDKYHFIKGRSISGGIEYRIESDRLELLCIEDSLKKIFWMLHYFEKGISICKQDINRYLKNDGRINK